MDTTQQADPRHVLVARADEELAHAHEQITRAGEELARAEKQLSKLEHDAAPRNRRLFDRPAVRGLTGLLLAACIGVAAIAWQSSYGDAAKEIIARWAPQRVVTSSPPLETLGLAAQPSPPAVQAAAANTASPQPAPLAQTTPEDVAPIDAAPSPKLAELLDTMVRDLTTAKQEIEHLKASQEQIARDDAKVAEQLKATQEQMARVIANQNLRSKISAPPPGPTSASTRKPVPVLPSPQSTAQPQASRP
jgi:hypothetical protein